MTAGRGKTRLFHTYFSPWGDDHKGALNPLTQIHKDGLNSSVESQKGIDAVQKGSIENRKEAIDVQSLWR